MNPQPRNAIFSGVKTRSVYRTSTTKVVLRRPRSLRRDMSIKIMSVHRGAPIDPLQMLGLHRQHAVLMLQHALDEQERLADDGHPLAIEEIGPDDHVGDAGLVLEREEDKPFRGTGALARD